MPRISSYRGTRSLTGAPGYLVVAPLQARTTSGNSALTATGWHTAALAYTGAPQSRLKITAASGTTPLLDVVIQDSPDGTTWTTRDTYPQQTGAATITRALPALAANVRVSWTIAGTTPSFTFELQLGRDTTVLQ